MGVQSVRAKEVLSREKLHRRLTWPERACFDTDARCNKKKARLRQCEIEVYLHLQVSSVEFVCMTE